MPPCNETDRECNILPHESELTSIWSLSTRDWPTVKEAKQMIGNTAEGRSAAPMRCSFLRQAHPLYSRLQARIVQATQAGRWGKVKALQRLLTHPYSGKVVAVRRVTENHGKLTPGVDGETWKHPRRRQRQYSACGNEGTTRNRSGACTSQNAAAQTNSHLAFPSWQTEPCKRSTCLLSTPLRK